MSSNKDTGVIVGRGMGGFLNPPGHPEHTNSVQDAHHGGNDFAMSLSSAATSDWLDDRARNKAQAILDQWQPLPLNHPDVLDWISHVMGYFKNCYSPDGIEWGAGELNIVGPKKLFRQLLLVEFTIRASRKGFRSLLNVRIRVPFFSNPAYWLLRFRLIAALYVWLRQDRHAGIHLIRKYYPQYRYQLSHDLNRYWGQKNAE